MKDVVTATPLGACLNLVNSKLDVTVQEALDIGATALMCYFGSPTSFSKPRINNNYLNKGKLLAEANSILMKNIVLHCNYLGNLGSPEAFKRENAMKLLRQEIDFAIHLDIKYIVVHSGNYTTGTRRDGLLHVANCINSVVEEVDDIIILLENSAGQGTALGVNFEELQCIIEKINYQDKIGVCLDINHAFSAGYDFKNDLDNIFVEFDGVIGLDKLYVTHISDAKFDFNTKKDRHRNIGYGFMGAETIYNFVNHSLMRNKIHILETNIEDDGGCNYANEIKFLRSDSYNPDLLKIKLNKA